MTAELSTFERTDQWKCDDIVFCVAMQPGSERLFLGSSDFRIYEFDTAAEKPERVPFAGAGHDSYVTGLVLVGDTLVSGSYDGRLAWWDIAERKMIRRIDAHQRWIRRVIATPDGERIISVADDMHCCQWDAESGVLMETFTDHSSTTPHHYPSMLYAVAVSPDGHWLATGDKTGYTVIRDLTTLERVAELETPLMYTWDPRQRRHSIGGIRSLAFSEDGSRLAVGGIGKIGNIDHLDGKARVEIFNWQSGERLHELEDSEYKGLVEQLRWHPDGKWLLCAGGHDKGFLTFYDPATGQTLKQLGNDGHIHGVVFSQDLSILYSVGHHHVERYRFRTV